MAQATIPAQTASAADLRIVLFGLRSAGKSSLLGALAQAAQTQEKYLKGQIVDLSQGRLAALHQRLFEGAAEQTEEEVVVYPVQFRPMTANGPGPVQSVAICDCSGQSVSNLLMNQHPLEGRSRRQTLVRVLSEADTVVLVVDASDKPQQLEREFAQFANFLKLFEESRARHSEVGGLPVYLVLTKCDLLAQPGDTAGQWLQRIEERKRQVAHRFQKFIGKQQDHAFGKIQLNFWATAIHRPALADRPAKLVEPLGVADLFRQCLQSAQAYKNVRQQSHRRLQLTLVSVAALVVVMVALGLGFYLARPPEGLGALQRQIEMRLPDPKADMAERVAGKDVEKNIRWLQDLIADPQYPGLPADFRQRVDAFLADAQAYKELVEEFKQVHVLPSTIDTQERLNRAQAKLAEFEVPAKFAATPVGRLDEQTKKDIAILKSAVDESLAWYDKQRALGRTLVSEGGKLVAEPQPDKKRRSDWLAKVDNFLIQEPPYPNNNRQLQNAAFITNQMVYNFDTVQRAREQLEAVRENVSRLKPIV